MSSAARDQMTADEFFAAHIELPFAQLIDGELVVPMDSHLLRHQKIVMRLQHSWWAFSETHPAAGDLVLPQDVRIDDRNVYVPDLFWVPEGTALDPHAHILPAAPPLVVEVLSPSTRHHDVGRKRRGYLEAGVDEVWIVDGEVDRVTVHRAGADPVVHADSLTTALVPGWTVDLAELFAPEWGSTVRL